MLARKLEEIGSAVKRNLIFPFVRIGIELKTNSIMKQKSYILKGTIIRGKNYVGKNTVLDNVDLGFGTIIQENGTLSNAKVGKYCSIAEGVYCIGSSHDIRGCISSHACFNSVNNTCGFTYVNENTFKENKYVDEEKHYFYEIGNDVWLGAKVSIAQGVHIGDGAVVGTGSLVLKDVEPYAIYAGVPAKKIGMRFSDEEIEKLMKLKWWDKGEPWIKEHASEFSNVKKFISSNEEI